MNGVIRSILFTSHFCLLCTLIAGWKIQAASSPVVHSSWPQFHKVTQLKALGRVQVSNDYYTVEHDLARGGVITSIALTHGVGDLLATPVQSEVLDENGIVYSEANDRAPRVTFSSYGTTEVLEIESRLMNRDKAVAGNIGLKTRFEHHWGYIKIRKEFVIGPGEWRATAITPFKATFAGGLDNYGFREGITEEEGGSAFPFGSCRWGKLDAQLPSAVQTNYLPRYVLCAQPGVQGIEWFMGSDLRQWELQAAQQRGKGQCSLKLNTDGRGIDLSVSVLKSDAAVAFSPRTLIFDYYLAVPLKEGHALKPWMHTSFNRNKGEWVSSEQVRRWAESGIQSVHCHNDGDYYDDGLFWRDGAYPPYPDMERFDKVLTDCRAAGIRTATYFSNKELHPSTKEFQDQGQKWGRKNLKGELQHNFYRGTNEFGVQMCLRSGWLEFLKQSIDRVLRDHPLDGVYYDWNVALLCNNPLHEPQATSAGAAAHWDIDELLQFMEWTRFRVGPHGMVIIHNTTTPMFATENFADYIVANEWGYGKWSGDGPNLSELPLEWSLVGARPRGVISYGQLDANSPQRLHRVFALQALVSGVTPWPASPETFDLFPLLKPIGDLETCRFSDWRQSALKVAGNRCASAVYSRPGEAWLLVANMGKMSQQVECKLDPRTLAYPISRPGSLTLEGRSNLLEALKAENAKLNLEALLGSGLKLEIGGDSAILLRLR